MGARELNKNHPLAFFVLLFAISIPFWFIADTGAMLSPALAACFLIHREDGAAGVRKFLGRVGDSGRVSSGRWLAASIFLMPALSVLTDVAMRLANRPVPQHLEPPSTLPGALAVLLVAATAEELGLSAYATDALQKRFSALATALLIGGPWALWQLPSMVKMGQPPPLIAWGLLATVAFRVIIVWLYNNTNGSLFAVILAQAAATTARAVFPGGGSSIGHAVVIVAAVLVAAGWGGRTLTSFRGQTASGAPAHAPPRRSRA